MTWFESLSFWAQVATAVTALSAAAVPVWWILRRAHSVARRKASELLASLIGDTLKAALKPLEDRVEEIYTQVYTNGNTRNTLRDKLGMIDDNIHLLTSSQRANLDNSLQPRFWCDRTGRCTYVNEALCHLFGLSSDTMTAMDGKGWLQAVENAQHTFEVWMECVHSGVPYQKSYTVVNQKTGLRTNCVAIAKPVMGKDGRTVVRWDGSVNPASSLPAGSAP